MVVLEESDAKKNVTKKSCDVDEKENSNICDHQSRRSVGQSDWEMRLGKVGFHCSSKELISLTNSLLLSLDDIEYSRKNTFL